jgi:multiple sugar transport system substrate-binding protein
MLRRTRRSFLAAGATAGAALLAACGAPATSTPAPAKPVEGSKPSAPSTSAPAAAAPAPTQAPAAPAKPAEPTKPAAQTAAPQAGAAPVGKVQATIRVLHRAGTEGDTIDVRAKEWAERNSNVVLKPEGYAGAEYFQKVQTLFAGGQIGEVIWNGIGNIRSWALKNQTIALDEFIKADNFDSAPYFKDAWDGQIVEGKHYGITFKAHPGSALLYFNKALFDEAKIPYPTDDTKLDQHVENATKLVKAPDQWGYMIPIHDGQHYPFQIRLFGPQMISKDGKTSQVAQPEAIASLEFDRKLLHDLKASPSRAAMTGNPRDLFAAGKIAMYKSGTWDLSVGKVIKTKFPWSVALFPRGPQGNRGAVLTLDFMSITTNSKFRPESWEIVKWLTDRRTGILLGLGGKPDTGNSGTAGGRKDVYESEELLKNPDYTPDVHEARKRSLNETSIYNTPANGRLPEVQDVIGQNTAKVYAGDTKDVGPFAQEMHKLVQVVLDKPL